MCVPNDQKGALKCSLGNWKLEEGGGGPGHEQPGSQNVGNGGVLVTSSLDKVNIISQC